MVKRDILGEGGFRDIESGILGRTVPTGIIFAPGGRVSVDGDKLRIAIDLNRSTYRKPIRRMLDDFINLWRSPDETLVVFARRWGALRVNDRGECYDPRGLEPWIEPMAAWRFLSRRAHAILSIAADLKRGNRGAREDWLTLSSEEGGSRPEFYGLPNWRLADPDAGYQPRRPLETAKPMSIPHAQGVIAGEVSEWMQRFGATIVLQFSDRLGWHLELNYRGRMLAAIALQLALVVADADSLFTCSGCGMPYIREGRKPAGDRANYCQYCGRDEALRKADKHRREKMAEARRLGAEGVTAAEIAKRLSVRSAATVRRWLKKGK